MAALALLAGHAAGRGAEVADGIARTADLLDELLPELERGLGARRLARLRRPHVRDRPRTEFATAREISLKLLETCRVAAEPLTATDLVHGPVAAATVSSRLDDRLGRREPARGQGGRRQAREAGAMLIASGTAAGEIEGAPTGCRFRRRRCRC